MRIYHNFIISSFLHSIQIVVYHPLSIVMFTTRNDITHITALHRMISIVYHKLISLIHVTLIVTDRSRSFMMHNHLHTFAGCIAMHFFHVKVRIGSYKIKHIVLALAEPIFPTLVPSFHQYSIKTMFGRKIDVTFHIGCISRVLPIRLCL